MLKSSEMITGSSNKKLRLLCWKTDSAPFRGAVHIVHGLAEHSERYNHVARFLTENGFLVYAHDHRGHGLTDPEHLGYIDNESGGDFDLMAQDATEVYLRLRNQNPDLPFFIIGHSMGSFLVQRMMQLLSREFSPLPSGIIYSGSNGKPSPMIYAGILLSGWIKKWKGDTYRSQLINNLTFGKFNKPFAPIETDFDWLSRDREMVQLYNDDPYCGFIPSVSFYHQLFRGLVQLHKHSPFSGYHTGVPILIIYGENDAVSNMGKGIRKLEKALREGGAHQIEIKSYPGARHELFNEINREDILQDTAEWMNKHLPESNQS